MDRLETEGGDCFVTVYDERMLYQKDNDDVAADRYRFKDPTNKLEALVCMFDLTVAKDHSHNS